MPESPLHASLVELLVQYAIWEFGDFADIAIREDTLHPLRREKPPRIGGHIPDVLVTDVPTTRTLIGEAKTLPDLETEHTRKQISAFVGYLAMTRSGIFVLSVPPQGRPVARRMLAQASQRAKGANPRMVILDPLSRFGNDTC